MTDNSVLWFVCLERGNDMMVNIAGCSTPYTDYFDPLVALVTHLSATPRRSRTVPNLSQALGFNETDVRTVLEEFRALFRKSRRPGSNGEHYYTVHLRYARRPFPGAAETDDEETGPLESSEVSALLQLISSMVSHETETSRLLLEQKAALNLLSLDIKQRDRANRRTVIFTLVSSIIAACAAIFAAFHR